MGQDEGETQWGRGMQSLCQERDGNIDLASGKKGEHSL